MSKISGLQSALNRTKAPAQPSAVRAIANTDTPPAPAASVQANRVGKVNIAAWMDPDFKASIRLVQARRGGNLQELLAEALNDLFAKYDVPQVVNK